MKIFLGRREENFPFMTWKHPFFPSPPLSSPWNHHIWLHFELLGREERWRRRNANRKFGKWRCVKLASFNRKSLPRPPPRNGGKAAVSHFFVFFWECKSFLFLSLSRVQVIFFSAFFSSGKTVCQIGSLLRVQIWFRRRCPAQINF